jgi:hypothetical protein
MTAGSPITSNAQSTPRPPVRSRIACSGAPDDAFTVSVAPNSRASLSFESSRSTAMMRPAPASPAP